MNEEYVPVKFEDYEWVKDAFNSVFPDDTTFFKHFDCDCSIGFAVGSTTYKRRHAFLIIYTRTDGYHYDINKDSDKFNAISKMILEWNKVKHSSRLPVEVII